MPKGIIFLAGFVLAGIFVSAAGVAVSCGKPEPIFASSEFGCPLGTKWTGWTQHSTYRGGIGQPGGITSTLAYECKP